MCRSDLPASFISISVWKDWICLKLSVPPQCWGTTQGDLFIWLLPSKLACPLDRWPLCPSSRWAVTFSGTKQLEGQLCGDPSYSLSLFPLAFTLSLFLSVSFSIPPCIRVSCLLKTLLYFFSSQCYYSDANAASDLRKLNLSNASVPDCIWLHYAWVRLQSCEDERNSHPLFCLSQSLAGWPHLYLIWSCARTHTLSHSRWSLLSYLWQPDHRCVRGGMLIELGVKTQKRLQAGG